MNSNYLHKDELLYELGIRGIASEGDTQLLRRVFRSVATQDVNVQGDYLSSIPVDKWISEVNTKICELQNIVSHGRSLSSFLEPRVRTRLLQLRGRLRHLTVAGLSVSGEQAEEVKNLQEKLNDIEKIMAS